LGGFNFNIKSSLFGETQIELEEGFGVKEGLYEFFKFNLSCYKILKIKNILIISINLSFANKILFQKM